MHVPTGSKKCLELEMAMGHSSATFAMSDWTVGIAANHVYDRIAGPAHRLDVSFTTSSSAAIRSMPHGLIGACLSQCHRRAWHQRSLRGLAV